MTVGLAKHAAVYSKRCKGFSEEFKRCFKASKCFPSRQESLQGRAGPGKKGAAREKSVVFVADRLPDYFDVTIDERQLFPAELAELFF